MMAIYKVITNNEHLVCLHGKNIQRNDVIGFQNQTKQGTMHCKQNNWTTKLIHLGLYQFLCHDQSKY